MNPYPTTAHPTLSDILSDVTKQSNAVDTARVHLRAEEDKLAEITPAVRSEFLELVRQGEYTSGSGTVDEFLEYIDLADFSSETILSERIAYALRIVESFETEGKFTAFILTYTTTLARTGVEFMAAAPGRTVYKVFLGVSSGAKLRAISYPDSPESFFSHFAGGFVLPFSQFVTEGFSRSDDQPEIEHTPDVISVQDRERGKYLYRGMFKAITDLACHPQSFAEYLTGVRYVPHDEIMDLIEPKSRIVAPGERDLNRAYRRIKDQLEAMA